MFDKSQAGSIIGQELRTSDGDKIGKIGQVYLDDYHDQPEWVTVNTGLFGTNESFVPLAEASIVEGGVAVPYTKDQIKDAPNIDDSGHLSEAEEQDLYTYYDIPFTTEGSTFADTGKLGQATAGTTLGDRGGRGDRDGDGVYDDVQDTAMGQDISEEEHVVTLNAERPVVSTETVPVERVRLDKQVEETVQTVQGDVRKERITLDDETADAATGAGNDAEGKHRR